MRIMMQPWDSRIDMIVEFNFYFNDLINMRHELRQEYYFNSMADDRFGLSSKVFFGYHDLVHDNLNIETYTYFELCKTIREYLTIDDSKSVDLTDALLCLQVASGVTPSFQVYQGADIDGDNRLGTPELLYVLRKVAGLE
jgi:hypothetical protein